MNVENIKKVRDHIASLPSEQFDMSDWRHRSPCGTVACIGGWTCALFAENDPYSDRAARKALGISKEKADRLFFGKGVWDGATQAQAVAVLNHLAETGNVNWSVAKAVTA